MKLAVKSAILCGTGAFLLATYTAVFKNISPERLSYALKSTMHLDIEPFAILGVSLPSALIAGAIGYFLGEVLSKPQKKVASKKSRHGKKTTQTVTVSSDDTFLADLETAGPAEDTLPPEAPPPAENTELPTDPEKI